MQRFFIQNFGCRATQADGAALEALLEREGLAETATAHDADLVVLNTCTVTSAADEDVRKAVQRVHRTNPAARILVTGCYAQRSPEELAKLPGVAWVVGNSHKTKIAEIVSGAGDYHGAIHVGALSETTEFLSAPVEDAFGDRTRPNLKVQDGCSNVCTFCIIPAVRGRSRSMPLEQVLAEVRALAVRHAEIVLTGINLGRWGREAGFRANARLRFADLLQILLKDTPARRLRISSVEPMDWSDDLLALMAGDERICRHIHMPLQSGSDTVLKRMKRRYRARHYEDRLLKAHTLVPDAAIGADVMTGFPGETDAEFRETYDFIARGPFTYLHVFTYSSRPGTPASELKAVDVRVAKERTHALRDLAERKSAEFRASQRGRTVSAVVLSNGRALTTNYITVELATPREAGALIDVKLGEATAQGCAEAGLLRVLPL